MSKLILFDALQAQAVENADLHIGSGTPCTNNPLVLMGEWDCGAQSACSSMCSAASTVVSALCSMNSTSFPASAETTFDLARNADKRFSMEDEQRQARKRSRDSSWLLSSIPEVARAPMSEGFGKGSVVETFGPAITTSSSGPSTPPYSPKAQRQTWRSTALDLATRSDAANQLRLL